MEPHPDGPERAALPASLHPFPVPIKTEHSTSLFDRFNTTVILFRPRPGGEPEPREVFSPQPIDLQTIRVALPFDARRGGPGEGASSGPRRRCRDLHPAGNRSLRGEEVPVPRRLDGGPGVVARPDRVHLFPSGGDRADSAAEQGACALPTRHQFHRSARHPVGRCQRSTALVQPEKSRRPHDPEAT